MKKITAILLCLAMILSLAACGGGETEPSAKPENTASPGKIPAGNDSKASTDPAPAGDNKETAPAAESSAVSELEKKYADIQKDELKWEYNTAAKTIVVSGEGPMREYFSEAPEWEKYCYEAEKVVIGDGVTSVGAGAFMWFSALTEVSLAETVEFIGDAAFCDCYMLRTVNFPPGLKYAGEQAFGNALLHSESGFSFPEGMVFAGEKSFYSAFKENAVNIPASLTVIGPLAFANCYVTAFNVDENNPAYASIDGILYDKNITTLINYPADKHDALFEIPGTVETLLYGCIQVTNDLERLVIPASVKTIEEGAVYWNYGLSYIDVAGDNQSYRSEDGVLFTADGKNLVSYPIASDRTEYTVPEGTERICNYAMSQAANLTELHTGEGLSEIGDYALYYCQNLTSLWLAGTLKTIGTYGLTDCGALTQIRWGGTNDEWHAVSIGENNELLTDGSVTVYCAE